MRQFKVFHIPQGDDEANLLTHVLDIRVTNTLDNDVNTAEISLGNFANKYVFDGKITINEDDTLKIYAAKGVINTTNNDHLIGVYTVKNTSLKPEKERIEIIAADKTYEMLSKIYAVRDSVETVDSHIENIVQTINENGQSVTPVTTDITSTRSDGSSFSTVRYTSSFKKAVEAIKELSQPEYTGDNLPYRFYFDENNVFHWFYPGSDSAIDTLRYNDSDVINMKFDREEAKAIAMVIYNAGEDLNGVERLNFELNNDAEQVKNHMSYEPMKDITENIRRGIQEQYGLTDIQNSTILNNTPVTNDTFIDLLDKEAKSRANTIMDEVGRGLWTADIDLKGRKLTPGKLLKIEAFQTGFYKRNLRINRAVHKMNKNGWVTKINVEEDPSERDNL